MSGPHLPGRSPRPDPERFTAAARGADGGLAAGFAAFDARHYWEAHEFWEPVWMAQPQASAGRSLMRGLIQLANAGLKQRMGREAAARRILVLAEAALAEVRGEVLGVTQARIAAMRVQVLIETAL